MLNFMHHVVHGGDKVAEVNQHSDYILDKLEKEYLAALSEPTYPIWEQRQPFQIPLIDTSNQPAHHCLYPLSGEELTALKKQINEWLESGCIVSSASLYGHTVLITEKKGGGGFHLCINYSSLNASTVTDACTLSCIDDLLS